MAAYANSGVCKALRIMLDGGGVVCKRTGLSGLSECPHHPFKIFKEGIIDGEVMSVFIMDAGSPGVKLQDVLMKTWRIRDLDLVA